MKCLASHAKLKQLDFRKEPCICRVQRSSGQRYLLSGKGEEEVDQYRAEERYREPAPYGTEAWKKEAI